MQNVWPDRQRSEFQQHCNHQKQAVFQHFEQTSDEFMDRVCTDVNFRGLTEFQLW